MRRMLDPKELGGGGGGAKIYRHSIRISRNDENEKVRAYFTYYTTSQTEFTLSTLKNIVPNSKTYECTGYYEGQNGKGPIIDLEGRIFFPLLRFRDISTSSFLITGFELDDSNFLLTDDVSEVN